jgi:tRNA dimethylallyltransferase
MTEAEAIAETALLTRKFARRQVGWFGRNQQIRWFDAPGTATDTLAVFDSRE